MGITNVLVRHLDGQGFTQDSGANFRGSLSLCMLFSSNLYIWIKHVYDLHSGFVSYLNFIFYFLIKQSFSRLDLGNKNT